MSTERPSIVFLDLDGVVIPTDNGEVQRSVSALQRREVVLGDVLAILTKASAWNCAALRMAFPNSRFVIISNWRRVVPAPVLLEVLDALDIRDKLHPDWFALYRPTSTKADDIADWLQDHPSIASWIAIDDDDLGLLPGRQIVTPAGGYAMVPA